MVKTMRGKTEATRRLAGTSRGLVQRAPKLATEQDGRKFAYAAMERLAKASTDKASAYPHPFPVPVSDQPHAPYRTGPQDATLQRDLFRIFKEGSEAAQLGFCSILTDLFAGDVQTGMLRSYRRLEAAGFMRPWGTPGTSYPVKLQTKKEAKALEAHTAKLMAEYAALDEKRRQKAIKELRKGKLTYGKL